MSYDQRCYDLAKIFIDSMDQSILGSVKNISLLNKELAEKIQETIEDFLRYVKGEEFDE